MLPNKEKARSAVSTAVRKGELIRPDICSDCCNEGVIHAHHSDYSKPLDVEWLCRGCHFARHWVNGKYTSPDGTSDEKQIKVSVKCWEKLQILAKEQRRSMGNVIEILVEEACK